MRLDKILNKLYLFHIFWYIVGDTFDERKYPDKDEQCQWIRWYLERLAEVHGDDPSKVTDERIKLYRKQANICALVKLFLYMTACILYKCIYIG